MSDRPSAETVAAGLSDVSGREATAVGGGTGIDVALSATRPFGFLDPTDYDDLAFAGFEFTSAYADGDQTVVVFKREEAADE